MSTVIDQALFLAPIAESSTSSRSTAVESQAIGYDPDELHWLGYVDTPGLLARVVEPEAIVSIEGVPHDEVWDCATDILFLHAGHEDAGLRYEVTKGSALKQKRFRHDNDNHHNPVPICRPIQQLRETTFLVKHEPYDVDTWDSPTDILYHHAQHDNDHDDQTLQKAPVSVLRMTNVPSLPPLPELVVSTPRGNRYGADREPYNAATWDSPTDINYAHGLLEDEGSDSNDADQIRTPKSNLKGFAIPPVHQGKNAKEDALYSHRDERMEQLRIA